MDGVAIYNNEVPNRKYQRNHGGAQARLLMKVGDIVRWTMTEFFGAPYREKPPADIGIIVEIPIGNGANVAWMSADVCIVWTPLNELEIISAS